MSSVSAEPSEACESSRRSSHRRDLHTRVVRRNLSCILTSTFIFRGLTKRQTSKSCGTTWFYQNSLSEQRRKKTESGENICPAVKHGGGSTTTSTDAVWPLPQSNSPTRPHFRVGHSSLHDDVIRSKVTMENSCCSSLSTPVHRNKGHLQRHDATTALTGLCTALALLWDVLQV